MIIGNSSTLQKIKRPEANPNQPERSFLLFSELDDVLHFSKEIKYDEEGYFKYSTYRTLHCADCKSKLGMLFIAASS